MDSLTHIVLGGCLGQLTLGKKAGRKAIVFGALADTIPDFDVFAGFWQHPVNSLLTHRGFTHSILFAFIGSLVFGKILAWIYNKDRISWQSWTKLMTIGLFSHIIMDSFTNYGTGLLEPFSHYRVSYPLLFIADPAFTLPMLLAFIILCFKRPNLDLKNAVSKYALVLSGIYLFWAFTNHIKFRNYFFRELANQHISNSDFIINPAPLNNILWGVMAKTDSGYYHGYHSLFSKRDDSHLHFIPSNRFLAAPYVHQSEYKLLDRFTQGYSAFTINDTGRVILHDLRFATASGWTDQLGDFTFSYPLIKNPQDTNHLIKVNPWPTKGFKAMHELWESIQGN